MVINSKTIDIYDIKNRLYNASTVHEDTCVPEVKVMDIRFFKTIEE